MQHKGPSVGEAGGGDGELCKYSFNHAVSWLYYIFKLNKGVTFVWVLMFYKLNIGNIDYKRKHAAYPSLLSGIPLT